ncbi:MAG: radical SAM protein [Candidatus Pacearchaeota archaeon]|nr:radical SAM protein [Candidatus Pacearchaeota archaeon]
MKILIIVPKYNLSTKKDYTYNFPFGLGYISSTLKKAGYVVDCINLNHINGNVEEIISSYLRNKNYEYILTGGNALLFSQFQKIIQTIRKNSSSKIVLGGPIITSEPELMFSSLIPDFAVHGEGEETILNLLRTIEKGKEISKVKGIVYQNKDKIVITPVREPIKDIEKIPYPDFDGFDFQKQLENLHCNDSWNFQAQDFPRTYPLLGSRGCPFNCTFCWHSERYRARSIKDIMKEIEWAINKFKINNLVIYDDCFGADKKRVREFCKEIKKLFKKTGVSLIWNSQYIVSNVDAEILKVMKDAGCEMVGYGFESFSPIVLRSMRKPITPKQIDFALKETLKVNMGVQGNFIFGDPVETKETAKETLDYWKKNAQAQITLGFVQPYPGSDLYKYCLKKGMIKDKLAYIQNQMGSDSRINMTEKMSDKEIQELSDSLLVLFSRYAKFVKPISMKKMKKNVYAFEIKCPYCYKKLLYKNCFIPNKFTYGFHLTCRNCHMRFVLVSAIQKIAYRFYSGTRKIRNRYVSIKTKIRRMSV